MYKYIAWGVMSAILGFALGFRVFHNSARTCFTPGQNCTKFIINEIDVRLILDKSNLTSNYSRLVDIKSANITYHIDKISGIVHNKVIIIDRSKVLTGSFNYSKSANNRNSENIVLIDNRAVAESYYQTWLTRAYD